MAKNFNFSLESFDSLMGTDTPSVINVSINKLHTFKHHPFKVLDDEHMQELVDSIKENGVLSPAIVRELSDGEYELISGHRRKHACELAGIREMPVLVQNLTDDEATIIMVDSNIQREELLPSEKAYAYRMKLEALKRKPGRPSKKSAQLIPNVEITNALNNWFSRYIKQTEYKSISSVAAKGQYLKKNTVNSGGTVTNYIINCKSNGVELISTEPDKDITLSWTEVAQLLQPKTSIETMADEVGESRATVQRFIRLTYLNNELMEYVDNKELPLNVGVELSYLSTDEQNRVAASIDDLEIMPSISMAKKFREYSEKDELTIGVIDVIMKEVTDKPVAVKLTSSTKNLFPKTYTKKDMSDLVERLVKEYFENGGE